MSKTAQMVLAVAIGSMLVVGATWFLIPREYQPCSACGATGARSCGATGCVNGRVPCSGACIKREDPNWQVSNNPHFPPNTLTLRYTNQDGSYAEVSQMHIGQTVTMVDGRWNLGQACSLCRGTTRVVCSACGGKLTCPTCKGRQEVPK